jgi:Family of unknown function (DUF6582)
MVFIRILAPLIVLSFFAESALFAQAPATDAGLKKYGNVTFADSVHHKYPLDTEKHIRVAWAFIHQKSHASKYTKREREVIILRIRGAAKSHGIQFRE